MKVIRLATAGALLSVGLAVVPLTARQNSPVDLAGTWVWVNQEDATNRFRGVDPGGRYEGLTINDAALSPPPQVYGFPRNSREFVVGRFLAALADFCEIHVTNTEIETATGPGDLGRDTRHPIRAEDL